jgi:hypothetical protein
MKPLTIGIVVLLAVLAWSCGTVSNKSSVSVLPTVEVKATTESYRMGTCPAYTPVSASVETLSSADQPVPVHCKVCLAGVLTQDRDGVVRCTFCGLGTEGGSGDAIKAETSVKGE